MPQSTRKFKSDRQSTRRIAMGHLGWHEDWNSGHMHEFLDRFPMAAHAEQSQVVFVTPGWAWNLCAFEMVGGSIA